MQGMGRVSLQVYARLVPRQEQSIAFVLHSDRAVLCLTLAHPRRKRSIGHKFFVGCAQRTDK